MADVSCISVMLGSDTKWVTDYRNLKSTKSKWPVIFAALITFDSPTVLVLAGVGSVFWGVAEKTSSASSPTLLSLLGLGAGTGDACGERIGSFACVSGYRQPFEDLDNVTY